YGRYSLSRLAGKSCVKREPNAQSTALTGCCLAARLWLMHRQSSDPRPHRLDGYMASNDPSFDEKAADIIDLYLNPPQHAAVFCVDEKTPIQALDLKGPVL